MLKIRVMEGSKLLFSVLVFVYAGSTYIQVIIFTFLIPTALARDPDFLSNPYTRSGGSWLTIQIT